jgi:hypothetical protein
MYEEPVVQISAFPLPTMANDLWEVHKLCEQIKVSFSSQLYMHLDVPELPFA